MAKISPWPYVVFFDDNGDPLADGLVYTYEAGTTTPKATYNGPDGLTPNANPVVLDDGGRADIWLGDGSYKFVVKDWLGNTIRTRDNLAGDASSVFGGEVFDITTNLSLDSSYANSVLSCINSPTITLLAVATAGEGFTFTVINNGTGTVTIDPNSSEQINGSTTLSLNPGEAAVVFSDGIKWVAVYARNEVKTERSLASATTTNLGAAVGNIVSITGTTTITSFGSSASTTNPLYFIRFTGALTLTHNATSLILPTSANITTANGDSATVLYLGSGNWKVLAYNKVSGYANMPIFVNRQVFTAGGTYTKTSGVTKIFVRLVGGGGGGGGADSSADDNYTAAGGGGGGGYSEEWINASAITTETVTIGTGGTAGNTSGSNGGNGSSTSFGAYLSAGGGTGGTGTGSGATADNSYPGGAGGAGSNGDFNTSGRKGGGGVVSNTSNQGLGGSGGDSNLGFGGAGGHVSQGTTTAPQAGNNYGGGGGGAANQLLAGTAGAAGADGVVIIDEYI